ncbi:thioredoxin family protein [Alteribacter natronophilus]|uniref:thioredoxin family protein n=1 Tax=Alteribacter natronophilus TaxID=2583810 RepID=UPI00110D858C|nr:thioredoxin family protein [Alteribacter natronophilus]TMW71762.1 thioredoxin family protein [Alteribacter natronophilus]
MKAVQTKEQLNEVKQEDGAVLYFTAGWCPDCVVIEPVLPELEDKHGDLSFYKVDRDSFIEECQENDIFGIPSFLVFKNGKEVHRFVSKDRKTKEEIDQFLTEAAAR